MRHVGVGPGGERGRGEPVQRGDEPRAGPAQAAQCPEAGVLHHLELPEPPPGRQRRRNPRPGRLIAAGQPVVPLDQGLAAVGEPVELEVVVGRGQLIELLEDLVHRHRALVGQQGERRHAAQRHRADHAERAEADPRGVEQLGPGRGRTRRHRPVRQHELERLHLGGEPAEPGAGAVRPGGQRARQRLRVDVAEVGHGQPEPVQLGVERAQRRPGPHGHQAGPGVRGGDPGPAGQVERHAGGRRGRGERVPAAERPHRQPGRGRVLDRGGDLGLVARPAPPGRGRRRRPGPVSPHAPTGGRLGHHYRTVSDFSSAGLLCEHVCRPAPPARRASDEAIGGHRPRTLRPGHRRPRPAAGPRRPGRVRPERRRHDAPGGAERERGPPGPGGDQVAALPLPDRARAGHARLPRRHVLFAARSPLAARRRHQRRPAGGLPHRGPRGAAGAGGGRTRPGSTSRS